MSSVTHQFCDAALIDTGTEERAQVDLPQGPPKKFDTVTVSLRLVLGSC